jgi:pimeloyl-ACP methyl ester carboxylesterase
MLRRIFPLRDAEREGAPRPRILERIDRHRRRFPDNFAQLMDSQRGVFARERPINVPMPTLGGKQIWADIFIRGGWRIQRNVLSGYCRLLDHNNIRRARGTLAHCRERFDHLKGRNPVTPQGGHVVMLVHGLGRSSGAFSVLEDSLRREGYETANVNYPSTRLGIAEHADNLEHIIETLEGAETLSFITHSLGGLVVRDLLARDSTWRARIAVHRLIMIAPPNKGSQIADRLQALPAYRWLTGESGQGLTTEAAARLPVPEIEFGIIAGGRGNENGFNPLLPGDNDGLVTVAETALHGARDFLLVGTTHGLIDDHPQTIDATLAFLRGGRFNPDDTPTST